MAGKSILVYIEGEGGGGTVTKRHYFDGEFRKAWKQFLRPLAELATENGISRFQCIPGRGGSTTVYKFRNRLPQHDEALRILIIDSEVPVQDVAKPWKTIRNKPDWAADNDCYLMVQCLETWLLADRDSLRKYYNSRGKACFQETKLKAWQNLEAISRKILQSALVLSTATCGKPYAHADGNVLIGIVEVARLRKLPSVARLFTDFAERISAYAAE